MRFFVVSLLLTTFGLEASTREGNSGFVIICPHPLELLDHRDIDLLDFYEGRQKYGYTIRAEGSKDTIIDSWLKRLASVDPERSAYYRERWQDFESRHEIGMFALTGLIDRGPIRMPRETPCSVEQIAQRMVSRHGFGDEEFIIVESLWNRLSETAKAGLILHEIVYAEAIALGHKNSDNTRRLVAWLASDQSIEFYREILHETHFPDQVRIDEEPLTSNDKEIFDLLKVKKLPSDGQWLTPCVNASMFEGSGSFVASLRLRGATYWMGTKYFTDEKCESPLVRSTLIFEITNFDAVHASETNYELKLLKSEFTIYSLRHLTTANLTKAGGFDDWKLGFSKDVTSTAIGKPKGMELKSRLKIDEASGEIWFPDFDAQSRGIQRFAPVTMRPL